MRAVSETLLGASSPQHASSTSSVLGNGAGVRDSFRYKHDQDWFVRGKMASFGFLRERPAGLPDPEPIRATHDLMCSMHNVHAVLRSVTHKLNVAG